MDIRKMNMKKRAVLQAAREHDGVFISNDLVFRVEEIREKKSSPNLVGAYLHQLFEDNYLTRERIITKQNNYRYKYQFVVVPKE